MSKLLDKAIEAVRKLPVDRQDELAELLLAASEETAYRVTPEERVAIEEGVADSAAGRIASDAEVQALFSKFRSV